MPVGRRSFVKACLAAAAGRAAAQDRPRRVLVLSYNIHHGEGMDKRLDLPRIAGVIKGVSPDVAMLQEVDRGIERSGRVDQLAELAKLTGMRGYFGKAIDHQGGEYGNAILTRLAIAEHCNVPLPGKEPRGVVSLRTEDGLLFLGTHLDVGRDPALRVASVERINEWIAARGDAPAVLAGDINDVRGGATLKKLTAGWTIAGKEMFTVPVVKPARQIDFIFYRPATRWRVVEMRVLDEPVASDHLPVFAVLELLP